MKMHKATKRAVIYRNPGQNGPVILIKNSYKKMR
jgi:hypothetical protein